MSDGKESTLSKMMTRMSNGRLERVVGCGLAAFRRSGCFEVPVAVRRVERVAVKDIMAGIDYLQLMNWKTIVREDKR